VILGGFAGIGWAEGLRLAGRTDIGLELDAAACRTRVAAGHRLTVRCDITRYPTEPFRGRTEGSIFSAPCPPFSRSGSGKGAHDLPLVLQGIADLAAGQDTRAILGAACQDPRSILTAEPMRWYRDLYPEFICMEQVPSVLPAFEKFAEILFRMGYSVVTGVVDAARYGLGQHRKRAVLLASRVQEVSLPAPTHGGPGQPGLVAMADVIGWGYTLRPAPTVTGGGVNTGGPEPFGNGSRQAMRRAMGTPAWKFPASSTHTHTHPTAAECAALQGFRPELVFHGGTGRRYLTVGNAVPPRLAYALVMSVAGNQWKESSSPQVKTLNIT
jgi:DNA (cytosine-5)-methyltransferase 1